MSMTISRKRWEEFFNNQKTKPHEEKFLCQFKPGHILAQIVSRIQVCQLASRLKCDGYTNYQVFWTTNFMAHFGLIHVLHRFRCFRRPCPFCHDFSHLYLVWKKVEWIHQLIPAHHPLTFRIFHLSSASPFLCLGSRHVKAWTSFCFFIFYNQISWIGSSQRRSVWIWMSPETGLCETKGVLVHLMWGTRVFLGVSAVMFSW